MRYLSLGNMPLYKFTDAQRFIQHHSTVLVFGDDIAGSGTYVRCGDKYGVLTAHHVAFQRSTPFDFRPGSKQRLGLGVAGFPHQFEFEMETLIPHEIGIPSSDEFGPDLLFIEIPRSDPKLNTITAKRQAWDISLNNELRLSECYGDIGCVWATAGHPEELKSTQLPSHGFDEVKVFPGVVGITGVETMHQIDEHDYFDVYASFSPGDGLPRSFAGESGGSLWRIPIAVPDLNDPYNSLIVGQPTMAGVLFYQGPIVENRRLVRSHGPRSIYKVAREMIS